MRTHPGWKIAVLALVLAPAAATAQAPIVPQLDRESAGSLEIMRPLVENRTLTVPTSVLFAAVRWAVLPTLDLMFELPIGHAGIEDDPAGSETSLGNPYLGVQWRPRDESVSLQAGIRLPVVDSDNIAFSTVLGQLSDIDRMEAFVPDVATISGRLGWRSSAPSGLGVRMYGGGSLLMNADQFGAEDSAELFVVYGTLFDYAPDNAPARFTLGVTGRFLATEDVADRAQHQGIAAIEFGRGRVRPGATIRKVVDRDGDDGLNAVVGAYVKVAMP